VNWIGCAATQRTVFSTWCGVEVSHTWSAEYVPGKST
jgi:hypothetical protein